ncbi:MAG: hypothetical protein ACYSUD_22870 [Planctomycetota bacterium]
MHNSPDLPVIEQVLGPTYRKVVDTGVGNLQQKIIAACLAGSFFGDRLGTMPAAFSKGSAQALALKMRTSPLLLS